jgi:ribonuclease BN (tRNA processing enzyme)
VRLTVIGCSGSFPSPTSAASCYLVEHDGTSIVLDLGPGSLGPLAAATDIRKLDGVLLSHLHADHCLDLAGMYVARNYHPEGPPPALAVHGPKGTGRRIADAYRTAPGEPVDGLERVFRFIDHSPDPVAIGPFTITVARVAHPVSTFAIRVEAGGATLAYSGDTGPTPALVELARGADVALFEASCLSDVDNPKDLHMTGVQAAEHATAAGAGRLVLTHLVAWNDPMATLAEGRSAFDGEVALAAPGMVVEL